MCGWTLDLRIRRRSERTNKWRGERVRRGAVKTIFMQPQRTMGSLFPLLLGNSKSILLFSYHVTGLLHLLRLSLHFIFSSL